MNSPNLSDVDLLSMFRHEEGFAQSDDDVSSIGSAQFDTLQAQEGDECSHRPCILLFGHMHTASHGGQVENPQREETVASVFGQPSAFIRSALLQKNDKAPEKRQIHQLLTTAVNTEVPIQLKNTSLLDHNSEKKTCVPAEPTRMPVPSSMPNLRQQQQQQQQQASQVASVFGQPSVFLRSVQSSCSLPDASSLQQVTAYLHQACLKPDISEDLIRFLLARDTSATRRSLSLKTPKLAYNARSQAPEMRALSEQYTLPLHLAIRHKLPVAILRMLVEADPSVLLLRDGPQQETPLCVLLKTTPGDAALADYLLSSQPKTVTIADRHGNTPLHLAASRSAALPTVQRLARMWPSAASRRNFQHQTPLDLARQRATVKSDAVLDFLRSITVV